MNLNMIRSFWWKDKIFPAITSALYITEHIAGDCLLAVGSDTLVKIHFHTNTPWKVLEYCASLGDVFDVVIENMERQAKGLQG